MSSDEEDGAGSRLANGSRLAEPRDLAEPPPDRRPLIERLGLGAIALVMAVVFGALAVAALSGGEVFLGVMAGIGALMTVWAAASGLRRG